ncbi:hypothetical protein E2320_003025, partial [Naja naja]
MVNMKSRDVGLNIKSRLVREIVFPGMIYGYENCLMSEELMFLSCGTDTSLEAEIIRLCLIYFDHVMHSNSLEKSVMLEMVSGTRRRRGKQRTRCFDNIKYDTEMNIQQLDKSLYSIDH